MNIGLTGGIATGKSAVSASLVRRGAELIDADQIAREVVLPGSPALELVFARFGRAVRREDGSLNRKKLGELVFADERARKDLEQLLHPSIRQLMRSRLEIAEQADPSRLVVVDVPLLFEGGLQTMFERTVLVYASEPVQLARLMARDAIDEAQALLRIRAQMPIEQKRNLADIVIDNSGDFRDTEEQIEQFLHGMGIQ